MSTWQEATNQDSVPVLRERSHALRWVMGTLAGLILLGVIAVFANSKIDWQIVWKYLFAPEILRGLWSTVLLWIIAMVFGIALGGLVTVFRMSSNPVASLLARGFVWLFRGIPVYVQFALWFNIGLVIPKIVVPGVYEWPTVDIVTPLVASVLALGISEAAYLGEVFRSGLLSVDAGQIEAGKALGFRRGRILWLVQIPQAMHVVLPTVGNEAITLLKTTSLAASIAYTELLTNSQKIYYVNGYVMELLLVASAWYLVCTSLLSLCQYFLERKYSNDAHSFSFFGKAFKRMRGSASSSAAPSVAPELQIQDQDPTLMERI